MAANSPASAPEHSHLSREAQATALWTYVHLLAPRFSLDAANNVVSQVRPAPGEDPKPLAKRLRDALRSHGISIKHTHALHAASRLNNHVSWHVNRDAERPRITFFTLDTDVFSDKAFASWDELADELRGWADRLIARGQLPLGVMTLSVTGGALHFSTPVPASPNDVQQTPQSWPLGTVRSASDDVDWLDDAPSALEKLRRHLEEGRKAVLDGYAVLKLCATSNYTKDMPGAVTANDASNSELILMREDDEDDPRSGYEIARGDELTCWHQLELSLRDDRRNELPDIHITVPGEGVGAWVVNGIRYVWALETLKPQEYVPGRVHRVIGIDDCERLLRRYRLAKKVHGGAFRHHEPTKHVDYLGGPPENYRVDLHFLLHQLNASGLTWETYCDKFGAEPLPMRDILPVGFVFQFLQNLNVEKPNHVFAKPNLSEMARIADDGLLRALMSRVESVRYVMPRDLDDDVANSIREAISEFSDGLRMQKFAAGGGIAREQELPHLVFAYEGEQLRASIEASGLVMYAATVPNLISTKGILPDVPNAWPWALGNALFLRFERRGDVQ
ncbi:hypothetical protein [Paraburkholderia strydomiana]|uniref:Uncharacterized protein n=1 Tax=Paraburkholderia strydomiana TaxID=1245417 RepID=A0ABW9BU96_9BURK